MGKAHDGHTVKGLDKALKRSDVTCRRAKIDTRCPNEDKLNRYKYDNFKIGMAKFELDGLPAPGGTR